MKTKKEEVTARPAYKRYTAQFKEQALERADRDGVPKVAQAPIDLREITLTEERTIYASINFPFSQDNWETMKFKGNITVEVLKAGRGL
jgi:hypothetical protein